MSRRPRCWRGAVSGFRERIERIQAKIKREKSRLRGDHPFNQLQKSVDSVPLQTSNLLSHTHLTLAKTQRDFGIKSSRKEDSFRGRDRVTAELSDLIDYGAVDYDYDGQHFLPLPDLPHQEGSQPGIRVCAAAGGAIGEHGAAEGHRSAGGAVRRRHRALVSLSTTVYPESGTIQNHSLRC